MQELINRIPSKFYADFLYDAISSTTINKSISNETITTIPQTYGYVFRIFDGINFFEYSDIDLVPLEERMSILIPKLTFSNKIPLQKVTAAQIDEEIPMKQNVADVALDEKLIHIREIYNLIKNEDARIVNPRVSYRDSLMERILINTEGSVLRQVIPRTRIQLTPIAKENGKTDYDFFILNREAGFECMKEITSEIISQTVKNSIDLLDAQLPPSGTMEVVLDPSMTGLVTHESFGHGLEADQVVRERSYLTPYFEKEVASEVVNISDLPELVGETGSYLFDDEGIIAKKTPLVENGIFTHYLHSRLTASILQQEPFGNGRREDFMHRIYPRMSNT